MPEATNLRTRLAGNIAGKPLSFAAAGFLALVVVACIAPDVLSTHNPYAGDPARAFQPPSAEFWFGTDQIGRDTFSRVVHGARFTVLAGLAAVLIGVVTGTILGTVAALSRGWVDVVITRLVDVLLAVPGLLLALFFVAVMGSGLRTVAIAVGLGSVALFARFSRAQVMQIRSERFVTFARDFGTSRFQSIWKHILPNVLRPIFALTVIEFGHVVLAISILGFLGYGVAPPLVEWGLLIADGRAYVNRTWWPTLLPGFVLIATVISLAVLHSSIIAPRQERSKRD